MKMPGSSFSLKPLLAPAMSSLQGSHIALSQDHFFQPNWFIPVFQNT
jgi:hypothetical protein